MIKPPCSEWGIWEGPEIEGHSQLGEMTLFVRRGDFRPYLLQKKYKRVWICREFYNWALLSDVITNHITEGQIVAIEVTPNTIGGVPDWVFETLEVHYKWAVNPKKGDHVCLGQPFHEYSFKIGDEKPSVNPTMYLNDKRLDGQYFVWYTFGDAKYYKLVSRMFKTPYEADDYVMRNSVDQREGWVHYKIEGE
jgi:hypothetical protein